jgi:proton-coupled amino acid transporter
MSVEAPATLDMVKSGKESSEEEYGSAQHEYGAGGQGGKPLPKVPSSVAIAHHQPSRHSSWWGATSHIVTAVVGAGVLSLPYSLNVLGWVGGPIMILVMAYITLKTSVLLADCYYVHGKRRRTYREVVNAVFGRRGDIILGWFQYPNLWLTAVAYNITGGSCMMNIAARACQIQGSPEDQCSHPSLTVFIIIFGACQVFLSQVPNMDQSLWVSIIGAVMSIMYSFITIGLSISVVAEGNAHGTVQGMPGDVIYPSVTNTALGKTMGIFNAFGTIVFAFSFSMILIEIQDTLHPGMPRNKYSMAKLEGLDEQQKAAVIAKAREAAADETESGDGGEAHVVLDDRDRFEVVQMRKAVTAALYIITAFFMTIAVLGGLAYGYNSCGNILSCFENPAWLIIAANTMVLIHVLAAYQVYSQPVFYLVETWIHDHPKIPLTCHNPFPARIAFRALYAVVACFISTVLPFFWDMVGLVGALGFWPTTVIFPVWMWRRVYKHSRKTAFFLEGINLVSFLLTICATIGAVYSIYMSASTYKIFG